MNRARLVMTILVNASAHFVAAEAYDHPLDLPPVAEANDVAGIAAFLGPVGSFHPGVVSEALYQFCCIGQCRPAGDEGRVHSSC